MKEQYTYLRIEHYSGHPEVAKAAEFLLSETQRLYKLNRLNGLEKWFRDAKKLIASLWIRDQDMFRFGTKKDHFSGKGRKQVWMTPKTLKLFKAMESLGWIKKVMSAIAPVYAKGDSGKAAVYCRQLEFRQLLSSLTEQDVELDDEAPLVTLSIDDNYVDVPEKYIEHERYRHTVSILEHHYLLLKRSNIRDSSGKLLKEELLRYRRRYTNAMGIGGRFYSSFCNLPKEQRLAITFNGEPAVSLDFSQLHPTLLLLYTQGQGTETNLFSTGDVYDMPDYPELPRAAHKKFINTILNASSKDAAAKSIASARTYWDIIEDKPVYVTYSGKKKRDGVPVWPEKPLAAAKKYVDDFIFRHPNFESVAYKGLWGELQYMDSSIIENVMLMANTNDIPVLPVHDELVVPRSEADRIRHFMVVSFHYITAEKFLKHEPNITVEYL